MTSSILEPQSIIQINNLRFPKYFNFRYLTGFIPNYNVKSELHVIHLVKWYVIHKRTMTEELCVIWTFYITFLTNSNCGTEQVHWGLIYKTIYDLDTSSKSSSWNALHRNRRYTSSDIQEYSTTTLKKCNVPMAEEMNNYGRKNT